MFNYYFLDLIFIKIINIDQIYFISKEDNGNFTTEAFDIFIPSGNVIKTSSTEIIFFKAIYYDTCTTSPIKGGS